MKGLLRQLVVKILYWEAKIYIKRTRPFLILVCGGINRENVKEDLIEALAANQYKVRGSFKGYNSEIGLPLSILNLEAGFSSISKWFKLLFKGIQQSFFSNDRGEILIVEVAVNNKEESTVIINNFLANITIFCDFEANISIKNIEAFAPLIKDNKQGISIINSDYPDFEVKVENNNSIIYFGTKRPAAQLAENIKETAFGQEFIYQKQKISLE